MDLTNEELQKFFSSASKHKKPAKSEDQGTGLNQGEFTYIVQQKEQDRICFLSGQDRYPVKSQKPTSVPTMISPEKVSGVNALLNKVRSNRGVGGLANLHSRFDKIRLDDTPGPNKYDPDFKKTVKQSLYPFGKKKPTTEKLTQNKNPGPGTYELIWQCRKVKKSNSFGGKTKIIPCVEVQCVSIFTDQCALCQNLCQGDYWQLEHTYFLCLKCMRSERHRQTKFKISDLRKFQKMRNCSYMHQHEKTTAALQLYTKTALQKKFVIENYLNNFFSQYG